MSGEVLLTGASGLIGGRLVSRLGGAGVRVRALTRHPERARALAAPHRFIGWDGLHAPREALAGADAVVHLAGEPVFAGLLTGARRARIRSSRVDSTRALVEQIGAIAAHERPRALLCASAIGYYGDRGEEPLLEDAPAGSGFLAELCRDWEAAALAATRHGVRCAVLRIGLVLAREGGALPMMAAPFRFGLGGRLGSGQQWVSWIHADDMAGLIAAALQDEGFEGAINATSPEPLRNAELTRALAKTLGRPAPFAVPAFVLRAALGELAGELLGSRRCIPSQALARGFRFAHPEIASALASELARPTPPGARVSKG
jgi:uncharacterized protein (TIGR01777 family)